MTLNWGIVSCGKICHDFVSALKLCPEEHRVVAVASKDPEKLEHFAKKYNIANFYASYEPLAKDKEVQVVYIGCVTAQHLDIAKMMLQNDKHVICEKPMTLNEKQTADLCNLAKNKRLFLMEAFWSRCLPIYYDLLEKISTDVIGELMLVDISFGKSLSHWDKLNLKDMGRGVILDLGAHAIQLQQLVFKGLVPTKFISNAHLTLQDCDESAVAVTLYPEGKTCVIQLHSRCELSNDAVFVGKKGTMTIPHFWCPTKLITPTETIRYEILNPDLPLSRTVGFVHLIVEATACIKSRKFESEKMPHADSVSLAKALDLWRNQVGVEYPGEFH